MYAAAKPAMASPIMTTRWGHTRSRLCGKEREPTMAPDRSDRVTTPMERTLGFRIAVV